MAARRSFSVGFGGGDDDDDDDDDDDAKAAAKASASAMAFSPADARSLGAGHRQKAEIVRRVPVPGATSKAASARAPRTPMGLSSRYLRARGACVRAMQISVTTNEVNRRATEGCPLS